MRDIDDSETSSTPHNPVEVFNFIEMNVPRFRGYEQEDAHDLLITLLDLLQTEQQKYNMYNVEN